MLLIKYEFHKSRMTITKGSQAVAQLVPVAGNGTTLADLQALLHSCALSSSEQRAFTRDVQTIRQ